MSDLFADDDDGIMSLITQKVPPKPAPKPVPVQQPAAPAGGNASLIYACPAAVSRLDQASGQYQNIGQFPVCFMKQGSVTIVSVIGQNKQPIMIIPITPTISWQIQQDSYCTTLDPQNTRWLFYFQTPHIAHIATSIALSAASIASPVVVSPGNGAKITTTAVIDHFVIDIGHGPVSTPPNLNTNISIDCSDGSAIAHAIQNRSVNEKLLLSLGDGQFDFIIIKNAPEPVQLKQPEPQPTPATPVKPADPQPQPQQLQQRQPEQQQPVKVEVSRPVHTIDDIQQTLSTRFERIDNMLASLKPKPLQNITIPNERIITEVQAALATSSEKDARLRTLDSSISRLTSAMLDDEELNEIHQELSELEEEFAAEKARTLDVSTDQDLIQREIDRHQAEVDDATGKLKAKEDVLRAAMSREIETLLASTQAQSDESQKRLNEAIEEQQKLSAQLAALQTENQSLAAEAANNEGAVEVAQMKEMITSKLTETVQEMGINVLRMIQESLDPQKLYNGQTVVQASMVALKKQAEKILHPGADEYDYDYSEEEEDGA